MPISLLFKPIYKNVYGTLATTLFFFHSPVCMVLNCSYLLSIVFAEFPRAVVRF